MRWERQDLRNIRKVYTCTDIIYILMSANTNIIVFGFTGTWLKAMIYYTQDKHTNHRGG
jgi:hypothetical protein